jgi:hypothetical protein
VQAAVVAVALLTQVPLVVLVAVVAAVQTMMAAQEQPILVLAAAVQVGITRHRMVGQAVQDLL